LTGVKLCARGVETAGAAQTYGTKRGGFHAEPAPAQPFRRNELKESAIMTRLVSYDPFADTGFDDLFRGCFRPVRVPVAAPVAIRIDVAEKDAAYLVTAEIPGVKKRTSRSRSRAIRWRSPRRSARGQAGRRRAAAAQERYYGSVYRAFTLPVELDEAASTAKYENGIRAHAGAQGGQRGARLRAERRERARAPRQRGSQAIASRRWRTPAVAMPGR
jgi:HSP20 family protein